MHGYPSPAVMLDNLRVGPFAAWGGAFALAQALGVKPETLASWQSGRRSPSYTNQQAIAALWLEHFGGESE